MDENRIFELPDEFLADIAGGEIAEDDKERIRSLLAGLKENGLSAEDAVAKLMRGLPGFTTAKELAAFVEEVWDEI